MKEMKKEKHSFRLGSFIARVMLSFVFVLLVSNTTLLKTCLLAKADSELSFNWEQDSYGNITITGYTGNESHVEIPSVINGFPVTQIGGCAFLANDKITSLTMPDSIIAIGDAAFKSCENIKNITFSRNITSIGMDAFGNCRSLIRVELPEGITRIEKWTFFNCKNLERITIPNGVTYIGEAAFCTELGNKLTNIALPEGLTEIGNDAFWGCDSLTSLNIPDSVISIGIDAICANSGFTAEVIEGSAGHAYCEKNRIAYVFKGGITPKPENTPNPIQSLPKTGDNSQLNLWFVLLSLAVTVVLALKRRTA